MTEQPVVTAPRTILRGPLSGRVVRPVKQAIATQVVSVFNDRSRGERPVVRRRDGLFGPGSVSWRVHGDVTSMLVGGVASLLLQMLHPAVLAGVWDHSKFRTDMHGRLRRTARFVAMTTYGGREEAETAIEQVRRIHGHVRGILPNGTPYQANDPALLAWVHVTETTSFLGGWVRYAEPGMSGADQDRYFAEMARIGTALGADPVPRTRFEAQAILRSMRRELSCDERTREVSRIVLASHAKGGVSHPFQDLIGAAGIDLLPDWARRMHGFPLPGVGHPLVRASTLGLARTLRWAFR